MVRRVAIQQLGSFGRDARWATPALLAAVKDPNDQVRVAATEALLRIDSQFIEEFTANFQAHGQPVQRVILATIGEVVEPSDSIRGLKTHRLPEVRRAAIYALARYADNQGLVEALRDRDPGNRRLAVDSLASLRFRQAVPGLRSIRDASDGELRQATMSALVELEDEDSMALALDENDPELTLLSLKKLRRLSAGSGRISSRADVWLKHARALLEHRNWQIRREAALLLVDLGDRSADVALALTSIIKEFVVDSSQRAEERSALAKVGPAAVVPLTGVLEKSTSSVDQALAANALYSLGRQAQSALPALRGLVSSKSEPTARFAARAIRRISSASDSALVTTLIGELASPDVTVRIEAAAELHMLGDVARAAVPALSKTAVDPQESPFVKAAALLSLLEISLEQPMRTQLHLDLLCKFNDPSRSAEKLIRDALAKEVSSSPLVLARLLADLDMRSCRGPLVRLTRDLVTRSERAPSPVGPTAVLMLTKPLTEDRLDGFRTLLPLLEDVLRDPNSDVRGEAAFTLLAFGSTGVSVLQRALNDRDSAVRYFPAIALARTSSDAAREAVPVLLGTLENTNVEPEMQGNALRALEGVGNFAHTGATRGGCVSCET